MGLLAVALLLSLVVYRASISVPRYCARQRDLLQNQIYEAVIK